MRELDDWRLRWQEEYLKGVTLTWSQYEPANPENDHDHCEFCFAKFMKEELPDVLRSGYSTSDRENWVCKACFADFLDLFEWKIEGSV